MEKLQDYYGFIETVEEYDYLKEYFLKKEKLEVLENIVCGGFWFLGFFFSALLFFSSLF